MAAEDKSNNDQADEETGASASGGGDASSFHSCREDADINVNYNHSEASNTIEDEEDVSEVTLEVNLPLLLRHKSPTNIAAAATDDEETTAGTRSSRMLLDSTAHIRHRVPATMATTTTSHAPSPAAGGEQATAPLSNTSRTPLPPQERKPDGSTTSMRSTSKCCHRILRSILKFLVKYQTRYSQQYKGYNLPIFGKDCVAGVTVAIMAIPLGMSYAKLAGLPAHYGIYASFVPPMVYPLVGGTSQQLAIGPAALVSLLVRDGLETILLDHQPSMEEEAEAGGFITADYTNATAIATDDAAVLLYQARYQQLALQCSFLVGILNIAMGLFQLGFVTQFLSRAVISGFCSGAAIIIASSQIKHLFGCSIANSNHIHAIVRNLARDIDQFNIKTFAMGAMCICILVAIKFVSQHPTISGRYPFIKWIRALGPIAVSGIAILLVVLFDLEEEGVPIVGNIPPGLPSITVDQWFPLGHGLWVLVISIVIISFVQSISISKRLAYKHDYEIDPSQELIALGMASLVGGIVQSYPTTGAMGQSAVNDDIGATSGVASIVTGLVVMCVLLFLTPVFEKIPLCVLAAIVISFVLGMFDHTEAIYLYRVHKFDFAVWVVAFLGTMFLGVEYGLGIAVAVSILLVLYESAYPKIAVLGRLPGTSLYRNMKQYPNVERYDGLVIVRIDAPLYFANAQNVRDQIRQKKKAAVEDLRNRHAGVEVKYIILDVSPVSHIDTTGLHVLEDMHLTQQRLGVQLCFCNPGISVMEKLVKSGIVDLVGRQRVFAADIDAVQWCLNDMDSNNNNNNNSSSSNHNHDMATSGE